MRNRNFIYSLYIIVSLIAIAITACEDQVATEMVIVRDCTGTYLRQENTDYKVCNPEKVDSFSLGQSVEVVFSISKECDDPSIENYVCNLFHGYQDLIFIQEINP